MTYAYFPGCSMRGTGRAYEESLLAVFEAVGANLEELEDWNCCGASAWRSVDLSQAVALSARNLAIAERGAVDGAPVDLMAPCAGCYRALLKTQHAFEERGAVADKVDAALATVGLRYDRTVRVRHPIDVLISDVGLERVAEAVTRPLEGVKVACYYGCLLVRPNAPFDDPHDPTSMDRLIRAAGAEPIDWPLKTRCCGASCYSSSPFGPVQEATLELSYQILREAKHRGADAIATACPLCQFNLEGFQPRMARAFGERIDLTVGFITQFLGLAMGVDERRLGIRRMMRWHLPGPGPTPEPVVAGGGAHASA